MVNHVSSLSLFSYKKKKKLSSVSSKKMSISCIFQVPLPHDPFKQNQKHILINHKQQQWKDNKVHRVKRK